MDGMLSQDEINALLAGMGSDSGQAAEADTAETATATLEGESPNPSVSDASTDGTSTDMTATENFELSDYEKDAVGEISNISMGTAATTLSSLLNQKVNITTPSVSITTWDVLSVKYDRPCVMLQISYKEGIDGNNVLILREKDVKIITDLMMGGSGDVDDNDELTELHLSAIGEAMNQMMGSAATSMSSMFNRKIDISPPVANVIETYSALEENLPKFLHGQFVVVSFKMQIGDLIDSEIMQLYPIEFAKELLNLFAPSLVGEDAIKEEEAAPAPAPAPAPATQPAMDAYNQQMGQMPQQPQAYNGMPQGYPMPQMDPMQGQNMGMYGMPQQPQGMYGMPQAPAYNGMPQGYAMPPQGYGQAPMQNFAQAQNVNVAPAAFQPFAGDLTALSQQENIDLIKDVPLEVTVELGRTKKTIKEILDFAPGTIIELNKIAGEAIDVLVNGKYVAKGEVVVIEESFGVRITEIFKENEKNK